MGDELFEVWQQVVLFCSASILRREYSMPRDVARKGWAVKEL